MIPLKIKLCLSFFIVVKNKALVKAQMKGKGSFYFKLVEPNRLSTNSSSWGSNSSFNIK